MVTQLVELDKGGRWDSHKFFIPFCFIVVGEVFMVFIIFIEGRKALNDKQMSFNIVNNMSHAYPETRRYNINQTTQIKELRVKSNSRGSDIITIMYLSKDMSVIKFSLHRASCGARLLLFYFTQ